MDLKLAPELREFIDRKIKSGDCASEQQVIDAAIRMMKDFEEVPSEPDIDDLRREVAEAVAEMDAGGGEAWDAKDIKARLLERHANRKRAN